MNRFIILIIILFPVLLEGSSPAQELFDKANQYYREGRYEEATDAYTRLVSDNHIRYEVYFNLANSYFKTGQLGPAILNYERARLLAPMDDDIRYNLRMAYSKTVDKIDPIPQLFYQRWWQGWLSKMSPSNWAIIAVIMTWSTAAVGVIYLFARTVTRKRNAFFLALTLLFITLFAYYTSWSSNNMIRGQQTAIVMSPSAYAKSSPTEKSTNLFLLHEGTRVDVLQLMKGWMQVRIANGTTGWMETGSLEVI